MKILAKDLNDIQKEEFEKEYIILCDNDENYEYWSKPWELESDWELRCESIKEMVEEHLSIVDCFADVPY